MPLPDALQHGIDQLSVIVEHDGAELIRKMLHDFVREEELLAKVVKADMAVQDLIDNGGMISPEETAPQRSSLYVYRPLIDTDALMEWAKAQGFASMLPPDDLHVTICYSKVPVRWTDVQQDPLSLTAAAGSYGRRIRRFGDAIVLLFDSPELQKRWTEFQAIGASWDHEGYNPHVTISYDPDFDISKIEPFDGPLVFGGEVFQQIKDNWADDIEEVELRKAADSLADRLNDAVMGSGKAVIDLGANLTTSRLVTFGYLAEAKERKITTYQVAEVLDDHICPVCKYMHGKTFSVEEEYSRVLRTLTTQNPQELRSIAPWPKQSRAGLRELNGKSIKQLQSDGLGSPPYHPGCRGIVVNEGTVTEHIALHKMPAELISAQAAAIVEPPVKARPAEPHNAPIEPKPQHLFDLIDKIQDQSAREKALTLWNDGDIAALRTLLQGQKLLAA
jgi:hypothetical protein